MIFLDTHVVVWLYAGDLEFVSPKVQKLLEEKDLFISPMVALELQYLYEVKRISVNSRQILDELKTTLNLEIKNDGIEPILRFALTESWTRDPFDRIIVSHAAIHKSQLVTKDEELHRNYSKSVW